MNRNVFFFFLLLSVVLVSPTSGQSIFLVTDRPLEEAAGTGNLGDFLRGLGYTVSTNVGSGEENEFRGPLSAEQIAFLESHDLVIFHRSTDSGFFHQDGARQQWNQLQVPLWNGSAFTARNTPQRWDWVEGSQAPDSVTFLEVLDPDHPIFHGIEMERFGDSGLLQLFPSSRSMDALDANFGEGVGNGTLLAETDGQFLSAMIVWEGPGAFVDGLPETHTHRRVFFSLVSLIATQPFLEVDENGEVIFSLYTDAGWKLVANVVEFTMTGEVTGEPPTKVSGWEIY